MAMSLVNQSYRLIAILLQSTLCKTKIEDLVTIRKKLSIYLSIDPFVILKKIRIIDPIPKTYVS